MAENTLLEKLNSLAPRFEEVGTLITDPDVIADQARYVRLTREYKDLEALMAVRKTYAALLKNRDDSKEILLNESDPDLKEMIEEATRNARAAAEKFAKDSDSSLGKIRNASQGQFSITNRDENTPYIKTVRVVTTINYYLKR